MPTGAPDEADWLKYATAESDSLVEYVWHQLGALAGEYPNAEQKLLTLQQMLGTVNMVLRFAQAGAECCEQWRQAEPDHYSDGRRVSSRIELEPGGICYQVVWHPQADHVKNQPRTLVNRYKCPSGAVKSVIIVADQILDTIDHQT